MNPTCPDCGLPYDHTRGALTGPYCTCPVPETMTTNTTQPAGATFASTLERELAAMTKERDELRAHADALAELLEVSQRHIPANLFHGDILSNPVSETRVIAQINKALAAYRASQQPKP
jgi:hypothetical protein